MEGFTVKPLTLWSIGRHDVLLDTAHDLLDSMVESSDQHNREPNGLCTLRKCRLDIKQTWI